MQRQRLLTTDMNESQINDVLAGATIDELTAEYEAITKHIEALSAIPSLKGELKNKEEALKRQMNRSSPINEANNAKIAAIEENIKQIKGDLKSSKETINMPVDVIKSELPTLKQLSAKISAAIQQKEAARVAAEAEAIRAVAEAETARAEAETARAEAETARAEAAAAFVDWVAAKEEAISVRAEARAARVAAEAEANRVAAPEAGTARDAATISQFIELDDFALALNTYRNTNDADQTLIATAEALKDTFIACDTEYQKEVLKAATAILRNNDENNRKALLTSIEKNTDGKRHAGKTAGGILVAFLGAAIMAAGIALSITMIGLTFGSLIILAGAAVTGIGLKIALTHGRNSGDEKVLQDFSKAATPSKAGVSMFSHKKDANPSSCYRSKQHYVMI